MEPTILIFVAVVIGITAALYQLYQIQKKSGSLKRLSLYPIFVILLCFVASITYIGFQVYPSNYRCSDGIGYASRVAVSFQVENPTNALGSPDYRIASVSIENDSVLIVDMEANVIIDRPGIDFLFYENLLPPQRNLLIDPVIIAVGTEEDFENPENFVPVFVWGDNDPTNNGGLPVKYFPEEPETLIEQEDLYNLTAIGIDINVNDRKEYRYVSVRSFPMSENKPLPANPSAEIDAIGSINNCSEIVDSGN